MTKGKFREPWHSKTKQTRYTNDSYAVIYDAHDSAILTGSLHCEYDATYRAILCTNALVGIDDPAAFMQAVGELREAAKLTLVKRDEIIAGRSMLIQALDVSELQAALAKLEESR